MLYSEFHFTKIVESHDNITTYINYQCPGNIKIIAVLDPTVFHLENMSQNWPLYSIIDLDANEIGNYPAENYFTQISGSYCWQPWWWLLDNRRRFSSFWKMDL